MPAFQLEEGPEVYADEKGGNAGGNDSETPVNSGEGAGLVMEAGGIAEAGVVEESMTDFDPNMEANFAGQYGSGKFMRGSVRNGSTFVPGMGVMGGSGAMMAPGPMIGSGAGGIQMNGHMKAQMGNGYGMMMNGPMDGSGAGGNGSMAGSGGNIGGNMGGLMAGSGGNNMMQMMNGQMMGGQHVGQPIGGSGSPSMTRRSQQQQQLQQLQQQQQIQQQQQQIQHQLHLQFQQQQQQQQQPFDLPGNFQMVEGSF